MGISKLVLV